MADKNAEHRVIIHADANAFFASVEQAANPDLRGKAIAVVGSAGRTVITTSSYEARAKGVKTGMALWEARRCCPELIVVVGDNKKYQHTSSEVNKIFLEYTPLVEAFSIDESWLDVTHSLSIFGSAENIVYQIKARILHRFGIRYSMGIAPNKLLAKLVSDFQKPDGLTVLKHEDAARVLERLPVGELCGVGKKTAAQLRLMSINTCGELGRCDETRLTRKFGIVGKKLKEMGQGIDNSPVVPFNAVEDVVKSVGHSRTLEKDISDPVEIKRFLLQLSEMVGSRARRYDVAGKTISLYVRYSDFFTSWGKQTTLTNHTNQTEDIYRAAIKILATTDLEQPVRLLGISLGNLRQEQEQLQLFVEDRKKLEATKAMDAVNRRFGDMVVTYGSLIKDKEKAGSHVIPPSWRPNGIKSIDTK